MNAVVPDYDWRRLLVLVISIVVRLIACAWSVLLLWRLRDWRVGFLSLMLILMAARQVLAVVVSAQDGFVQMINPLVNFSEIPGLAVSVMALLAVFFIQNVIQQQRKAAAIQHSVMESSPDFIMLIDRDTILRFINRTVPDLAVEQVIGTPIYDYLPAKSHPTLAECLRRVNQSRQADFYETEYHPRNGPIQYFESRVSPVIQDDEVTGYVIAASDITRRKQTEMELRESERELRESEHRLKHQFAELELIYQTAPVGLCLLDAELRCLRINDELAAINGMPADAHIGKRLGDVVPDIAPMLEPIHRKVIESGEPIFNVEVDRPRPTDPNEIRSYLANYHPLKNHEGVVVGVSAVVQDITDRKRSEQALRVRDHAIANAVVPIALADVDGELTYVNQATANLWGYDGPGEMVNQPLTIMSSSAADITPVMDALREEGRWIGERLARRKDGSTFPVFVSACVIRDQTDTPLCLMASIMDLTEMKEAEAEIRRSRERLADLTRQLIRAQETERRLVARELHDELGQVLTSVNYSLGRIKQKSDDETRTLIEESQLSVTRAIDQVRNISMNLRPSVLDDFGLVAAVEWLVEQIRRQSAFDVELKVDDIQVHGDLAIAAFRFVQEAITNAMRHAQATRCWIALRRRDQGITIVVRDNGKGFQGNGNSGRKHSDHAGLSNMRERIELIGGRFSLVTSPGKGTTVCAWLPSEFASNLNA